MALAAMLAVATVLSGAVGSTAVAHSGLRQGALPSADRHEPGGVLSGTVTGAGAPLPQVWVTLTPVTPTGEAAGIPRRTLTDGSGRYAFQDVTDRHVKVHVRAPAFGSFVDTYFPDSFTFTQARTLGISAAQIVADVDLPEGGSVAGQVIDAATGQPVAGARVVVRVADAPAEGVFGSPQQVPQPGGFRITGLPPVPMTVEPLPPSGSNYLFGSAPRDGLPVDGRSTTTGATLQLRLGAEIRGTVRDDLGEPVPGASVMVTGCRFDCPLMAHSDAAGSYRITGVPPRSGLGVVAWRDDELLRQWFPAADDAEQAAEISLVRGQVLEAIDFSLVRGAYVTVRVLASDTGEPVPEAIVMLTPTAAPSRRFVARNFPSGLGRRVGPLAPGEYVMRIIPSVTTPYLPIERYLDEQFGPEGTLELDPADDIELVARVEPATNARPEAWLEPRGRWPGLAPGFLAPGFLT